MAAPPPLPTFQRFENPVVRTGKLNDLVAEVADLADEIETLGVGQVPDPGDLTLYYQNGKA